MSDLLSTQELDSLVEVLKWIEHHGLHTTPQYVYLKNLCDRLKAQPPCGADGAVLVVTDEMVQRFASRTKANCHTTAAYVLGIAAELLAPRPAGRQREGGA